MNATDNRKSMDDVLASIRRIVRAEKDPDRAEQPGTGGAQAPVAWDEEPLPLTPDMRADAGEVRPEAISRPGDAALAAGPEAGLAGRDALRELVREVLLEELARGGFDQAVREIVRDELIEGEVGGNISQNVLRLVRAEVQKALGGR